MEFNIIETKKNDCYVIYDVKNGGMCCCSAYTIKQLIESGHVIKGVTLKPRFKATLVTKSGELRKKDEIYDVAETKRSATTIEKGIKLSRNELKEKKEKQLVKETEKKAAAVAEKKKQKDMEVKATKMQKSKVIAKLLRMDISGSEYQCNEKNTYELTAYSPAGLTQMRKLAKEMSRAGSGFHIEKDASETITRRGHYCVRINSDCDLSFFDSDVNMQICSADEVILDYENYYDDTRLFARFKKYNSYIPEITDKKGFYSELERTGDASFGSTADGGYTLNGIAKQLRRQGRLII